MGKTAIEWTATIQPDGTSSRGHTWNPLRGCTEVSPGCASCFAAGIAARFSRPGQSYEGLAYFDANRKAHWTGTVRTVPEKLAEPLGWKKPSRVFVNSMADLFHPDVPDEFIDQVFAVMALAQQHTFQILTKRPERMARYCSESSTPFRVAKAMDRIMVAEAMKSTPEQIKPYPEFPGYFISNRGFFLTTSGTSVCIQCGNALEIKPRAKFCSPKCRSLDFYHRKHNGKERAHQQSSFARMSPDVGEHGHRRIMLYKDGISERVLVHRAVLEVFDRSPVDAEQGCHRDGDTGNNHIANLRWGTREDNWIDRKRHGNRRSYSKLTEQQVQDIRALAQTGSREHSINRLAAGFGVSEVQILNILTGRQWSEDKPIEWPLPNCWKGVSVEDQKRADERIPHLLRCPAAVRFLSIEPLLGPIDLRLEEWQQDGPDQSPYCQLTTAGQGIHWIICGGESGPNSRPMHIEWVRKIRDDCKNANVPMFFKQWGHWVPDGQTAPWPKDAVGGRGAYVSRALFPDGSHLPDLTGRGENGNGAIVVRKVGKKAAGRLLDGVLHDEFPATQGATHA